MGKFLIQRSVSLEDLRPEEVEKLRAEAESKVKKLDAEIKELQKAVEEKRAERKEYSAILRKINEFKKTKKS